MAATQFRNVSDLKRQPTKKSGIGGFPQPMQAQMRQGIKKAMKGKTKFPHPKGCK